MDRARALDCTGRERHVLTMCGMRAARRGSGHTQQANLDGAVKLYLQSKGKLSAGDLTANQVMRTLAACLSAWPCSHPSPHASVTAGGVGRGLCSGRSAVVHKKREAAEASWGGFSQRPRPAASAACFVAPSSGCALKRKSRSFARDGSFQKLTWMTLRLLHGP